MYVLSLLLQLLDEASSGASPNVTNFDLCPSYSPFFGTLGIALAMCLTNLGSAYGIAKSSIGISSLGVMKPEFVMKGILPVIFAGVVPIYGIIVAIMVVFSISLSYTLLSSFLHLAAGLTVGLSGVAAGMAIGIAGDAGVRACAQQPRMYVPMVLILIFSEALGLYGVIVSILLASGGGDNKGRCAALGTKPEDINI